MGSTAQQKWGAGAAYVEKLASSYFCLAASGKGGGWGMRFGSAVLSGCIPLIVMANSTEVPRPGLRCRRFSHFVSLVEVL